MTTRSNRRSWSGEEGIALVLAMFMVLVVSLLGASLATVGRTETMSSLNYKTMSQARYAAESGLHTAANYLIHTYVAPGVDAGDPLAGVYDTSVSPVTYNNEPVILTTAAGEASNYPVDAKVDAFEENAHGELMMSNSKTAYTARARLLSMRQFPDAYSGGNITIQTWEITGIGKIKGAGAAAVEVSAIIETQAVPAYRYAAFATKNGCAAMSFAGGGSTDSYNSGAALGAGGTPVISNTDGDVGTNGNLDENGGAGTIVNGTLSTPRGGVGNCTENNVTALTIAGKASVKEGLVKLPQAVKLKTPDAIVPAPPTTSLDLTKTGGCPAGTEAGLAFCSGSANGVTFTPTNSQTVVSLGNVTINANAVVHLNAGIYELNSLKSNGNMTLQIDSGPVVIRINGKNVDGSEMATPLDLTGGSVIGLDFQPRNLQFVYGGTQTIKINGGSKTSLLTYAPNATVTLLGNSSFYGAVVGATVNDTGGAHIHYDRALGGWAMTEGNPTMTSFSWSSSD
ncbi:MAG TPA: pilus assembly PilX N-terminal domain-containing protein [Vicinamibacterales bacterium]|nr:pilus assembly PilX N-terminal domain-containing protein [Vicinamibacterales bacterium]